MGCARQYLWSTRGLPENIGAMLSGNNCNLSARKAIHPVHYSKMFFFKNLDENTTFISLNIHFSPGGDLSYFKPIHSKSCRQGNYVPINSRTYMY